MQGLKQYLQSYWSVNVYTVPYRKMIDIVHKNEFCSILVTVETHKSSITELKYQWLHKAKINLCNSVVMYAAVNVYKKKSKLCFMYYFST